MPQDALPMVSTTTYRRRRRNFADVAALAWFVGQIADQRAVIDELEDELENLDASSVGDGELEDLVRLRHAIVAGRGADHLHELERLLSSLDPAWSTRV